MKKLVSLIGCVFGPATVVIGGIGIVLAGFWIGMPSLKDMQDEEHDRQTNQRFMRSRDWAEPVEQVEPFVGPILPSPVTIDRKSPELKQFLQDRADKSTR